MGTWAAAEVLDEWEASRGARAHRRALNLLERMNGSGDYSPAALALGRFNGLLLELRERAFGACMQCETNCPACGDRLEFALETTALRVAPGMMDERLHHCASDGIKAAFRVPTIADLEACAEMETCAQAAQALLARCIEQVEPAGAKLNARLCEAIAERMAAVDPQADISISLSCPQCAHAWIEPLDMAAFFAREMDAWAQELLDDIHTLAASYGWSERDILALSPARRRYYVERVAG